MIGSYGQSGHQGQIVRAFLAGKSKRLALTTPMHGGTRRHRYSTDGQSLYVWGNLVAERRGRGVYITDAGWLTMLTKNVLNEVLEQMGVATRIYSKRGKWRIWNYETKLEQDWPGGAVVAGGRVRLLRERGRPGIVFPGYERRRRWRPPPPPPPPKPGLAGQRTLFNPKHRYNLHTPAERKEASKLFRRVYGIAYRQLQRRDWIGAAKSSGIMWGLVHAARIERPPLTRLVRSWYAAIEEIIRVAKGAGAPDFWTRR
jgi:hypothetical protein